MMMYAHGTFVLGHKFRAQKFWEEVRESRATAIQYVGEMCRYLLSAPPSEGDVITVLNGFWKWNETGCLESIS